MDHGIIDRFAREVRESPEIAEYRALRAEVMADETVKALIGEYHKRAVSLQMGAMTGKPLPESEQQRFGAINTLLYAKPEVARYLLAEMRAQQLYADILKTVADATDLDMGLPEGLGA